MPEAYTVAEETIIRLLVAPRVDPQLRRELPIRNGLSSETTIDWQAVWTTAEKERVAPLLYHATRHIHDIPEWWRDRCRAAYLETGILNTLRFEELGALLAAFRVTGVGVIALKGAALIDLVYANPALRPMVDLDLLVRKEDVGSAMEILTDRDYRIMGHEVTPGAMLTYENEVLLQKQTSNKWQLELHWHLFDSPYYQRNMPEMEWWRTANTVTIEGERAQCLSPEWILIHLCGHLAFHHQSQGLLWWNDLAELIRKRGDTLAWDYVIAQAQKNNMVLPLQRILPVLADIWSAPVPSSVINRIRAIAPSVEEIEVNMALTSGQLSAGSRLLVDAKGLKSPRQRTQFLMDNVFPSATYMDARYGIRHPLARPLYYIHRWLRGMSGIVRDAIRRRNHR